jgi:hypothetical protein
MDRYLIIQYSKPVLLIAEPSPFIVFKEISQIVGPNNFPLKRKNESKHTREFLSKRILDSVNIIFSWGKRGIRQRSRPRGVGIGPKGRPEVQWLAYFFLI